MNTDAYVKHKVILFECHSLGVLVETFVKVLTAEFSLISTQHIVQM